MLSADYLLSTVPSDHDYCRVSPKQAQCKGRLGVQECQGIIGVEVVSFYLLEGIAKNIGTPKVDMFASRLCHQLLNNNIVWKPDPGSIATDAMQQSWKNTFAFTFPPLTSGSSFILYYF